jgi:hypothetical protein
VATVLSVSWRTYLHSCSAQFMFFPVRWVTLLQNLHLSNEENWSIWTPPPATVLLVSRMIYLHSCSSQFMLISVAISWNNLLWGVWEWSNTIVPILEVFDASYNTLSGNAHLLTSCLPQGVAPGKQQFLRIHFRSVVSETSMVQIPTSLKYHIFQTILLR